jgi:hypothetical protein
VAASLSDDSNEVKLRTRELLLGSGDTACPLADLARADIADIAAATVAATEDGNDTETEFNRRPSRITLILPCLTIHPTMNELVDSS